MNTTKIELNAQQIDLLRGVLYEYYITHNHHDELERKLHNELENILADAENELT